MATKDEIFAFAAKEAELQGVPTSLVRNVIEAESGGSFNAIGPKTRFDDRAYGPMQLMGATAKDLGVNRMDWQDNIRGGVKYLSQLSNRFQDPTLVAAAYNAGPGNVEKYGGVPPFKETQNYVKKVVGMAKDPEDWKPVSGIAQPTQDATQATTTGATQQASSGEDWTPVTGIGVPTTPQVQTVQPVQPARTQPSDRATDLMQGVRQQAFPPKTQFQQDVAASFSPLDVLRGKTTGGQLIFGAADLMAQGIKGGLSKLGLSDEYLGIDRNKQQPVATPTQSISDILKGTAKIATQRPGLLLGTLGTGLLDPANLVLPGAMQKSLVAATPVAIAKAVPKTVALAQNIAAGGGTAALTSAAAQQATTGTINPEQVFNEAAVAGLLTTPTALLGGVTTPRTPMVLNQKQQIAQTAIDQGAVLPPTQVNPSIANILLEGYSGKVSTKQAASIKNQDLVNAQARKTLGLQEGTPITSQVLKDYRDVKGQAYEALRSNPAYYADKPFLTDLNKRTADIQKRGGIVKSADELNLLNELKQMRFDGDGLVEKIKVLRSESDVNFRANDADKLRLAQVQKFAANQLEDLAERNLVKFGQPDVMSNFKQARQDIAKSYTIEKALNAASGDVSAAVLGQRAKSGKIVPSEMQALANAAATYPEAFGNVARIGGSPGISPLDFGAAAVTSVTTGKPSFMASVLGRPLVREAITSPMYQRNILNGSQTPGLLNRITSNPMTNYGLGQLPEYGTERFLLPR
jgi:hypothetical protein